jgi:flagella basal body P-ring formation protein FlgA
VSGLSGVRLETEPATLVAVLDPSIRIGEPTRIVLTEGGRRVGEATVTVTVMAQVVKAIRPIPRGSRIQAADVAVIAADLRGRPLRRLPSLEEVTGARARLDIGADTVVTHAAIAAEPLVRAGDIVRARARIGLVDITGNMVAAESGVRNDVIRVVNPESRHAARARVVGHGEVEVQDVR